MSRLSELEAEEYARRHLLASGIVAELKTNQIYIWTIKAEPGKLSIAIDLTRNPEADMETIRQIICDFLAPLKRTIEIKTLSIEENCCYGVCHGCLNGDPQVQTLWVDKAP